MIITEEFLRKHNACEELLDFGIEHDLIGMEAVPLMERLFELEEVNWALWLTIRTMSRKQCVQFACHCARSVLHIFEERFPHDNRPRDAIEATDKFGTPDFDEEKCKDAAYDVYVASVAAKAASSSESAAASSAAAATVAAFYAATANATATASASASSKVAEYFLKQKEKISEFVRLGIKMLMEDK